MRRSRSAAVGERGVHTHAVFSDEFVFGFFPMLTAVPRRREHSEAFLVDFLATYFTAAVCALFDTLQCGVDFTKLAS